MDGAEIQISQFPGARYKGFYTLSEAEEWFNNPDSAQPFLHNGEKPPKLSNIKQKSSPEMFEEAGKTIIYTDGGCLKNPGPGGYGVVVKQGKKRKELSSGFSLTTNNRMELMACIAGLKFLKSKGPVVIYTDSKYVVNGINKGWAKKWRANDWKRSPTASAENSDLWAQILDLCDKHSVNFLWVKGHAGNPENERCDELASKAASQKGLPPDTAYNLKTKNAVYL